jgi:putative FmdB family regulatory protein
MPIYEYACERCGHEFELLVRGTRVPACPECASEQVARRLSLPAVSSETTKAQAMRAAKKRDKVQGNERVQEQIRYEKSHND